MNLTPVTLHDGIIVSQCDTDIKIYRLGGRQYPRSQFQGKREQLHKTIMRRILQIEPPKGYDIDHINNNPLDNRRENLQLLRHRDNVAKGHSKSSYLRVGFRKTTGKYRVRFWLEGVQGEFGNYPTAELAAFWADVYAYRLLPPGTIFNFPERIAEIRSEAEALTINYPWQRDPQNPSHQK